eukprot:TRINITY_DN964_c0_g1_i3.p1 TRINITY_DN964_c0_g1~~TRINITY_DN964_c0_g1_i3.p1  ORF type:complete len:110 (-),score=9.20 TRINITY_DN964_c0_g1_i3:33-362(-)
MSSGLSRCCSILASLEKQKKKKTIRYFRIRDEITAATFVFKEATARRRSSHCCRMQAIDSVLQDCEKRVNKKTYGEDASRTTALSADDTTHCILCPDAAEKWQNEGTGC